MLWTVEEEGYYSTPDYADDWIISWGLGGGGGFVQSEGMLF